MLWETTLARPSCPHSRPDGGSSRHFQVAQMPVPDRRLLALPCRRQQAWHILATPARRPRPAQQRQVQQLESRVLSWSFAPSPNTLAPPHTWAVGAQRRQPNRFRAIRLEILSRVSPGVPLLITWARGGGKKWWALVDSNHRPPPCEGDALPLSQAPTGKQRQCTATVLQGATSSPDSTPCLTAGALFSTPGFEPFPCTVPTPFAKDGLTCRDTPGLVAGLTRRLIRKLTGAARVPKQAAHTHRTSLSSTSSMREYCTSASEKAFM